MRIPLPRDGQLEDIMHSITAPQEAVTAQERLNSFGFTESPRDDGSFTRIHVRASSVPERIPLSRRLATRYLPAALLCGSIVVTASAFHDPESVQKDPSTVHGAKAVAGMMLGRVAHAAAIVTPDSLTNAVVAIPNAPARMIEPVTATIDSAIENAQKAILDTPIVDGETTALNDQRTYSHGQIIHQQPHDAS